MESAMSFNLIVPVAADKKEYEGKLPYVFSMLDDGIMVCVKSILGLNLEIFDHIYYTILKKHDEEFSLRELLEIQFRRLGLQEKTSIVVLERPTSSQAETVYMTVETMNISGGLMIKDGDCYVKAEIRQDNAVCIYPLDSLSRVNPQGKSYVAIDDGYFVTNIIEHRIVSRYFCVGGYVFKSVDLFKSFYVQLRHKTGLYMSHIIYAMLLNKFVFRPIECKDYVDWGTSSDFYSKEVRLS